MKILFCGGGALGSHGLWLARGLDAELAVVDFDRVETKNLASQWFVKQSVGKNKATALKLQMQNFHGRAVRDFTVKLTDQNTDALLGEAGLLVDCFDNAEARALVQDYARAHAKPCVHAGLAADGAFGVVRWDADFTIDAEDTPGQATCEGGEFLPLIVRLSGALVRSLQDFLKNGTMRNWNIAPLAAESFVSS